MIPIHPPFPSFNHRRNLYNYPYNHKNIYSNITQNSYSPSNSSPHYKTKNSNENHFHNNNFNSYDSDINDSKTNYSKDDNKTIKKFKEEEESRSYEQFFEIFGIKLYFDDLLILALLFFLYKEEVNDSYLYIILFMLLLN